MRTLMKLKASNWKAKATNRNLILMPLIVGLLLSGSIIAQTGVGIFGGGAIYKTNSREANIAKLKTSGVNFVVVWTVHVQATGDLNLNVEFPIVSNGEYIGDATYPNFRSDMTALKTQPTSINRLEIGLSGWGSQTFDRIQDYYETEGFGSGTTMYENWKVLKDSIPEFDAVNFDDEDTYDEPSMTAFAVMLADLGYKVTLCPYLDQNFWSTVTTNVNAQRPGAVDGVYLQNYAGGAENNPCDWNIAGIPTVTGLRAGTQGDTPAEFKSKFSGWNSQCNLLGGWIWNVDQLDKFPINTTTDMADYVHAINTGLSLNAPPVQAFGPNPADGATDVSISADLSWSKVVSADSFDVYFGTSNPPAFIGNHTGLTYDPGELTLNTTFYWAVDSKNAVSTTTGDVWSFTTYDAAPGLATNPVPADIATEVILSQTLSWIGDKAAESHDVYFGTANPPEFVGNQTKTSYVPDSLVANTTYYWQIGEVNTLGTTKGSVWSFTTLFDTGTSVNQPSLDETESLLNKINLYPNPVTQGQDINVYIPSNLFNQSTSISIVDILGQVLVQNSNYSQPTISISSNNLNKGLYLMQINIDNDQIVKRLLIK